MLTGKEKVPVIRWVQPMELEEQEQKEKLEKVMASLFLLVFESDPYLLEVTKVLEMAQVNLLETLLVLLEKKFWSERL